MIIGRVGTGKSFAAEEMSYVLDPTFTAERTAFTKTKFMELVNSNLPFGSAYVADETGSWFGARDWNTKINKLLTEALEIMRMKQHIVFFTVPLAAQSDITLRRMADIVIKTRHIHRNTNWLECGLLEMEGDSWEGTIYKKFPRIRKADGTPVTVSKLMVDRPPGDIEKRYKELKKAWTVSRLKDIGNDDNEKDEPEVTYTTCSHCGHEWKPRGKSKSYCPRCHKI